MPQFGMGQAIRRSEDWRFLTGHGRYTDDISLPDQAYVAFVRSPHAHATITGIDTDEAAAAPGVLAIYTIADLRADNIGDIPCLIRNKNRDGSRQFTPNRPVLAKGRVRYVGEPVVAVIAETQALARDAADLVMVDYDDLPAIVELAKAATNDAPKVWDDAAANTSFDWGKGDEAATEKAFAEAAHVVTLDLINNRLVPNSMEPRMAIGEFDPGTDRYTFYTSSQGSHMLRKQMATAILGIDETRLRVVTPDVGGGFGMKIFMYPEYVVAVWASKKVGRPVKWTGDRNEAFLSDTHGRDHVTHAELALDKDGRFLGLRVDLIANMGAYLSNFAPYIPIQIGVVAGVYTTPAIFTRVRGVFTNTAPVDAYRGAGRPESIYLMERMVDKAARQLGMAPDEIRRRNFIPKAQLPYATPMGYTYDSGDFQRIMETAMDHADWKGFAARKAESAKAGKLRGLGLACYIEACAGGNDEMAELSFDPAGKATLMIGTQSNGQGHATAYAQIVAAGLGIPFENIQVVQGDTDIVRYGNGTGGSRSVPVGSAVIGNTVEKVIAKGKRIAAHMMEAAEADISFEAGNFTVAGTDRSVSIQDVIRTSYDAKSLPEGEGFGMDETGYHEAIPQTFPNGCHICEVEIDAETGITHIDRYTVVDDVGNVVNPLLVAGQVHGGIGQGIGQALLEQCVYDAESGQLITGSFMDYGMPRAADVPSIDVQFEQIPCATNPFGIKGAGEAGAIGAPPSVINAIVDALADKGVRHIDMPATPEKVWKAIRAEAA
ncbi:MAG: carbon monoxide dehydrogenase [Rhodospirillaceae bacterium]|nr:carbon monoxide dehydrogenase [Rhodospirillaceae bacterium]